MLHHFALPFPCARGVAKYLVPFVEGIPAEHRAESKQILKYSDLPTVDTLPDLDIDTDSTWGTSESDESVGRSRDLQHEIDLKTREVACIQKWCPEEYEMVKTLQLAPRNQGRVDLMKSINRGRYAAVKRMPNSWMTAGPKEFGDTHPDSTERPWFDIGIVTYLHEHGFSHVCEPWGVFSDGLDTFVVSSYASEGELFAWLERDPAPGPDREVVVRPIMRQLFSAVRWLHNLGVAHCDISLENVLITNEGGEQIVKLIDFGMATLDRTSDRACGKKSYMAPEMHLEADGPYDVFATDAFALGVVLFSVCCREYPWNSTKPGGCKLFQYVQRNGLQSFVERRKVWRAKDSQQRLVSVISKPLLSLLEGLLQMKSSIRMTLGEQSVAQAVGLQRPSVWSGEWLKAEE